MTTENILDKICHRKEDELHLNYSYFKQFANTSTFDLLTDHIISTISKILETRELFIFHLDVKGLTCTDVDKYYKFCVSSTHVMGEKFPDKLQQCYVHNASELFKLLYLGFSCYLTKRTRSKFQIIQK